MINFTRITFLAFICAFSMNSQTFKEIPGPSKDYWFSSSAIGDLNNDGAMDIIISGAVDTSSGGPDTSIAGVYLNDGVNFSLSNSFQIEKALHLGDMKLFDINNDGLLDLVITGLSYNDIVNYKLYTYINTGSSFELIEEGPGKIYGSIDFGDFNNNGKLDFITNGAQYIQGSGFVSHVDIYKNIGGSFEKSLIIEDGAQFGNIRFADFNNDNALDLIQVGTDIEDNMLFKIYRNVNGQLVEAVNFASIGSGNIAIGDFDADGLLDIVAQGLDENYEPVLKVFFNEGDFSFRELDLSVEATSNSSGATSIAIGDLNSDGYNDFVTVGDDSDYNGFTKIFLYDKESESFIVVTENTGLINVGGSGNILLQDVNGDKQLDVLVSGFTELNSEYTGVTRLFKNLSTSINLKPEPPTILDMEFEDNKLLFSWDGAIDDKTPMLGLQYELRVGISPGGSEIAKYVVNTPSWMLKLDETPETLYWAVRSIDASKLYSEESVEVEETILSTPDLNLESVSFYPNPATDYFSVKGIDIKGVDVYSQDGKLVVKTEKVLDIDIKHLASGVYILHIETSKNQITKKLIVK